MDKDDLKRPRTTRERLTRRETVQLLLFAISAPTIPAGLTVAVSAETDEREIKKTAETIQINSPAMSYNNRDEYIDQEKDERNVDKRTHRGLIMLGAGLASLLGGICLIHPERTKASSSPSSQKESAPPDQMR